MDSNTGTIHRQLRVVALLAALAVSACTPINRFHGYAPSDEDLTAVKVGRTSRDSIIASFGPPTSEGVLENDAVYYVSSQFRHVGGFAPQEVDRQVLEFTFTSSGVVRNITRYTLEDSQVVMLDRRVTEDGINDVSFIAQLLGSFGQVTTGTLLGQ